MILHSKITPKHPQITPDHTRSSQERAFGTYFRTGLCQNSFPHCPVLHVSTRVEKIRRYASLVRKHGRSKVARAQTTVWGGKLLKYCLHPFQGVRHPNRVSGFSSKSSFMCETWLACIRVSHICYKQQVSYESYLDWPTGFPVKRDGIEYFYAIIVHVDHGCVHSRKHTYLCFVYLYLYLFFFVGSYICAEQERSGP